MTNSAAENITAIGRPATSEPEQISGSLPTKRSGVVLADEQRDPLLDRLAQGARNAELSAEFGISSKQVQGVRMGCAREIAKRRAMPADGVTASEERHENPTTTASIEEIVRYLRQQDDVVVRHDDGYLVNGRFRMSAPELIARANRMRSRQSKPSFQLPGTGVEPATISRLNRHPLFLERSKPAESGHGGFQPVEIDTEGA